MSLPTVDNPIQITILTDLVNFLTQEIGSLKEQITKLKAKHEDDIYEVKMNNYRLAQSCRKLPSGSRPPAPPWRGAAGLS